MIKPLRKPAAVAQQSDEIAVLNARVAELNQRDRELLREQLELEKSGVSSNVRATDAASLHAAADRLLAGENVPVGELPQPNSERLRDIVSQRRTIAAALQLAERKLVPLLIDRAVARQRAAADAWAELTRERALAVAKLQRLNLAAQEMLVPLRGPFSNANMPAEFNGRPAALFLGGDGSAHAGDFYDFLRCVVDQGIVTRGELDQA